VSGEQVGCRFCLDNGLLHDAPVLETEHFYMLESMDPLMPVAGMIIPKQHTENPFEMSALEWADFGNALAAAKAHFAVKAPDGFTLGWNVGAVGGQHVFHTHLHIIPRFKGEKNEGRGIRDAFRRAEA
jgi:diadenosine tetraphosphate (Ap4A) HIT family hydrolase